MESRELCERAIVLIGIQEPHLFSECINLIKPQDFSDGDLRSLFEVLTQLVDASKPFDLNRLSVEIKNRGIDIGLGGVVAFVTGLLKQDYVPANWKFYCEELRRLAAISTVELAAMRLLDKVRNDPAIDLSESLGRFERDIACSRSDSIKVVSIADAARKAIERQREANKTGTTPAIKTDFRELDQATGGFFRGQLVMLAGESFKGKTTLALNLASQIAMQNHKTLFVCLEMKDVDLAERELCNIANIELDQFAQFDITEAELLHADAAVSQLARLHVDLICKSGLSFTDIAAQAKYAKATTGLDVLFVDHLKRIPNRNKNKDLRLHLNETAEAFKDLASELDIVVVLLHQLRIDGTDNEPTEDRLSESKNVFEGSDILILMHRGKSDPFCKLILPKSRKTQYTEVMLSFDGPHQRYENYIPPQAKS